MSKGPSRWTVAIRCRVPTLIALATLLACCPPVVASAAPPLPTLPATFTGTLPCADCVGIVYQIDLLPRGAYLQRMTYLKDGQDLSVYEIGRWEVASDETTLSLDGGREARTFWQLEDSTTVRKLDLEGRPIESKLSYELKRAARSMPMEPRVRLSGMFTYMADAARFRHCLSGLSWPVAMSDDYLTLERAYTRDRSEPGSPLMVMLEGRIAQRPRMEGEGTQPTLIVEKFLRSLPGEKCPEQPPVHTLEWTRWVPRQVGGKATMTPANQREAFVIFDSKAMRFSGSGGCNRITGSYKTEAPDRLTIGQAASTMMSCPNLADETAFLLALEATRRYRIAGRNLELFDDKGTLVVRFEEANL